MLQLIKLEIRKYKLKKYIKGVFIAILFIMAFLTMSYIDNKVHSPNDLDTYQSVIWMINVLSFDVFLIFSSTIMGKIIIGEYKDKTILVMFCYPIDRKKIMLSKLFIVGVFGMSCVLISNTLCILYTVILDSIVDVVAGSFSFSYISSASLIFLAFAVMTGIMSLLPFTVGMKKKSVPSTVVTAVVIAALAQPIIGSEPQLIDTLIKLIIITLITLTLSAYTIIKKINTIDDVDVA
ncbi:ABC transporter permease [Clostridium sp. KNHs214]|uniref:ABC transporter permease n=1 Tax=Clostridium sp. KNHs214 TaxID=1540257 RepID=UPI000553AF7F|nr:ABC transporter permease [Clostridium sp. KNHs214]